MNIKKTYSTLKQDLEFASGFVSKECLKFIGEKKLVPTKIIESMKDDLEYIEGYFSIELGAKRKEEEKHELIARQILSNIDAKNKKKLEMQARIRRSIG